MQVHEARAAAEKAQQLLQNVANRKRTRQLETNGLVITRAWYGNRTTLSRKNESSETHNELTSQVMDVTLPLSFLVDDSGQLKVFYFKCCFSLSVLNHESILCSYGNIE